MNRLLFFFVSTIVASGVVYYVSTQSPFVQLLGVDCTDIDDDGICDEDDPCPFLSELINGDECEIDGIYGIVENCACSIDENPNEVVFICTDPSACNYYAPQYFQSSIVYIPNAGLCVELTPGCTTCSSENTAGTGSLVLIDADSDGICDASEQIGCTNPTACNFNSLATDDDLSCILPVPNCFQCLPGGFILFFDSDGDGICNAMEIPGCTLSWACNFNPGATEENGSCIEPVPNCFECNGLGGGTMLDNDNDGICNADELQGCTSSTACNYNPLATDENGTCGWAQQNCSTCVMGILVQLDSDGDGICNANEIHGCTNMAACNFNMSATENDDSCIIPSSNCTICGSNGVLLMVDSDFDGICDALEIIGCTNSIACNYLPAATDDSGLCNIPLPECTICFGNFPFLVTIDTDQDGICNLYDLDDDNDGCPDLFDSQPLQAGSDSDGDGIADECDLCQGDDQEGDLNEDGICDGTQAQFIIGVSSNAPVCGTRAVSIKIYNPGTAILVASAVSDFSSGAIVLNNITADTYDLVVKVSGFLAQGIAGFQVQNIGNTLILADLRAGDINGDNAINLADASAMNQPFGKSIDQAGYNPLSDLNCDGQINLADVSLLNAAFGLSGADALLNP